ncbi:S8 family serine peptidase [Gottfriedia acidiceleris]|uniref:S8 family serine peptidase n=1 Tax=Gottfriedia acidiceleris TaxID=371036 RepID=A0ABY4JJ36_9BACI|nr:S8 family serine peptidase [Gottfriedia acidiceleris]UPM53482.1 S8 family serine peptidase [Gottfriedia acidiceleris]
MIRFLTLNIILCFLVLCLNNYFFRFNQTVEILDSSEKSYEQLINRNGVVLTPKIIKKMLGISPSRHFSTTNENSKQIAIAVLDSGVFPHEDLTKHVNKIIAFKDFVNNYAEPYDDNGHGTLIAGLIAGNGNTYEGINNKTNIVGVKVLDKYGEGNIQNTINGINWVIENKDKYNIKIINISYGFNELSKRSLGILKTSINNADKNDLMVICSIGNKKIIQNVFINSEKSTYPASFNTVLSVGAMDYLTRDTMYSTNKYRIAPYTVSYINKWMYIKPDFILPGTKILTLNSNIGYLPSHTIYLKEKYTISSGSSLATAVLSGLVSILFEQFPNKTNSEMKSVILNQSYASQLDNNFLNNQKKYLYFNESFGE